MPILPPNAGSVLTTEEEDAIDSIVDLPDYVIPKALDSKLTTSGATVDPITGEWTFEKSINIPTSSINLEKAWSLTSAGESFGAKNLSKNIAYRVHVTQMGSGTYPTLIKERAAVEFEAQPIDTDLLTNPNYSIVIPSVDGEDGQTVTTVIIKVDPSSVLTNIIIEYKINGIGFASETVDLVSLGGNLYQIVYEHPLDVDVDDTVEATITSGDGDVVWLGDSSSGIPYLKPTVSLWDKKEVLYTDSFDRVLTSILAETICDNDGNLVISEGIV